MRGSKYKSPLDRLDRWVDRSAGCWLWTGPIRPDGYVRLTLPGKGKAYAHRWAYELIVGPIPEGMKLDHLCRVRHCVNPDHLEPVTHRENVLRGTSDAAENATKTHCKRGHDLSFADVRPQTQGKKGVRRDCVECRRVRKQEKQTITTKEQD